MKSREDCFLYEVSGLMEGEFIFFQTDSKKIANKLINLMDSKN